MAEGLIPEDEPEEEEAEFLADTLGFATSLAFETAKGSNVHEEEATEFLRDQRKWVNTQLEHLHEQRNLQISRLKARRLGDWLKVCFQMFTAFAAICVGALLLTMLLDAFNSRKVIVEPFDAPSTLAANGLTGKVLAGDLLDGLTRLQSATRAAAAKRHLENAWSGDIKVEVPETGVSIGEIDRLMHERFGHDEHIGGDLRIMDDGGFALTVRGDGVLPKTFNGPQKDLEKLTTQAAEYVYGQSEPVLFANYLNQQGRNEDAVAFIEDAYAHADANDKPELANAWGNADIGLNRFEDAASKYRLAINYKPRMWKSWDNLVVAEELADREEEAWRAGMSMMAVADKAPKSDRPSATFLGNFQQLTQDWTDALTGILDEAKLNGGVGAGRNIVGPLVADNYARLHDWKNAELYLTASDPDDSATKGEAMLLPAYRALDDGDATAAAPLMETFYKAWQADQDIQSTYDDQVCLLGLAYALTGRVADAEPIYAKMGRRVACYAARADGLEGSGDHAGADKAYENAIALAPDLPLAWYHRGVAYLRRGDLTRAESDLAAANARGPRWADPLKAWGDVLAARHQWRQALGKYDEALKYAPNWRALIVARANVAHKVY